MVFFTCNACGESLKKAQVEKHVNVCRGCQVLSCIDCGKDFWGDDYRNHLQCISEDQKYGGKGYVAKANKGDVKQQQWIERVHSAMNTVGVSARLKDILNQVSSYDNVPRKKQKFQNWMKNSLKIHDTKLHDQVWDIFSAAISNQAPEAPKPCEKTQPPAEAPKHQTNSGQQQNGTAEETAKAPKKKLNKRERKEARQMKNGKKTKNRPENGTAEGEEEKMEVGEQPCAKKNKRKRSCEEEEDMEVNGHTAEEETPVKKKKKKSKKEVEEVDQTAEEETEVAEEQTASKGKFNWKGTIKAVLRQAPDEGLSVKKVRKKVLAAYYSFSGESNFKSEEDLLALFNKKINGNPKFKVLKDKVRLVK